MIIRKTLREFVKKYVKNYFVSTVGQVDFSKVYIEK